ncbi:MAG: FliI/YscN family ATPase [Planctomycetes bacterium]|nr:FliI/YscN family ATPase [Planctomycetota bacterium]
MKTLFERQRRLIKQARLMRVTGRVIEVSGLTVCAEGLQLPVGSMCTIVPSSAPPIDAQVVGVGHGRTILLTMAEPLGTGVGDEVTSSPSMQLVGVGRRTLGRVLDGAGRPIDEKGPLLPDDHYPVYGDAPEPLARRPIEQRIATGVRSIDSMLTIGGGQRMGLFAGTGVGKSVLLGMMARYTSADVTVIALVGERGREVGDFLRKNIGEEGAAKTVMVVSTSDESAVLRVRACFVATAIAEYFRDEGKDVLLLVDSATRMAMAQRQIGLAAGEPPTTKGYPPSVFALLPRLLERAGRTQRGSITGIYTVLVEGDDINEPVSDAIRGVLDGHVWLSRSLANRGHWPAVSVLESISRLMVDVVDEAHLEAAKAVRRVLALWADVEDLVNLGAYAKGSNVEFDLAVEMKPQIDAFFQQSMNERARADETRARLLELHERLQATEDRLRTGTAEQASDDAGSEKKTTDTAEPSPMRERGAARAGV